MSCCVVRWFVSVDGKWCLDKVRGFYLFICRSDEVGVLDCGVGFVCINWQLFSFLCGLDIIVFLDVRFFFCVYGLMFAYIGGVLCRSWL